MVACARRVAGFGSGKGLASRSHRVGVAVCARLPLSDVLKTSKNFSLHKCPTLNVLNLKIHKFTDGLALERHSSSEMLRD